MLNNIKTLIKPFSQKSYFKEVFVGFNGGIIKADSYFSDNCQLLNELNDIGIFIAHDCFALPAASKLAKQQNSPLIYDAVDFPFMNGRTGAAYRSLPTSGKARVHQSHKKARENVADILTISDPMASKLSSYFFKKVSVLQNAYTLDSVYMESDLSESVEKVKKLAAKGSLVCSFGTLFPGDGLLETFDAFEQLDSNTYFIIFGKFQTSTYEMQVNKALDKMHKEKRNRIILLPFLNKSEMFEILKLCDLCIMMWDHTLMNLKYGLPNRFWDAAAAGLPMVHSNMIAINELVLKHGLEQAYGAVPMGHGISLAKCIKTHLKSGEKNKKKIMEMAKVEAAICKSFFQNLIIEKSAKLNKTAILSRTSIRKNERVKRQVSWLNEVGHDVVLISMEANHMHSDRYLSVREYFI